MAINGITFDRMRVTTKSDALLYYSMLDNNDRIVKGYKNELNVSATGLSVFVSTGACVVQGRLIDIDEEELVSVSANDTGYICLVIDLTQANTSEGEAGTPGYTPVNNQVRLEVVKTLVQQDLFEDGKLYTFPLASFTSTGTTVNLTKVNHNQRIVESGSNANGNWTKFADGTMICHYRENTLIDIFTLRTDTIQGLTIRHYSREYTYPQTFVGIPTIVNAGDANGFGGLEALGAYSIQNNKATIYCECLTQPTNIASNIVMIGRWK